MGQQDVVMAAVSNYGDALKVASDELKADKSGYGGFSHHGDNLNVASFSQKQLRK